VVTILKYLIWSNEHRGWWQQNRHGYTANIQEAGVFSLKAALDIEAEANMHIQEGEAPEEYIVPTNAVAALLVIFDAPQMAWIGKIAKKLAD